MHPALASLLGSGAGIAYGLMAVGASGVFTACFAGLGVAALAALLLVILGDILIEIGELID